MKILGFFALLFIIPLQLCGQEPQYIRASTASLNKDTAAIMKLISHGKKLRLLSPDSATALLNQAFLESEKLGYDDGKTGALIQLAEVQTYLGDYEGARKYYFRSLRYAKNINTATDIYNGIAKVFYLDGDYRRASIYSYQVTEAATSFPHLGVKTAFSYMNLSVIWWQLEDLDRSLSYLHMAEKAAKDEKNKTLQADIMNKLGIRYMGKDQDSRAFGYYSEALTISRESENKGMEMMIVQNISSYYRKRKLGRKADAYMLHALKLAEDPEISPYYKSSLYTDVGLKYYLAKQYDKAEYYLLKSLKQSAEVKTRVYTTGPYELLSKIYAATGRHREAVNMQEIYIPLKYSLWNKDKVKAIGTLEVKFRRALREKEIAGKQLSIEKQKNRIKTRNIVTGSLVVCLVMLCGLAVQLYRNGVYRRRLHLKNIHSMEQDSRISILKATLEGEEKERTRIGRELHDGTGSMLSVIKMGLSVLYNQHHSLSANKEFHELMNIVDKTTSEVRETAHDLIPDPLLKGGMDEALSIFCEALRKKHRLDLKFQYYGDMPRMPESIERGIFRIIKELMHYRISRQAVKLMLQLNWQDEMLSVILEDNGLTADDFKNAGISDWQGLLSRIKMMNGYIEVSFDHNTGNITEMEFDLLSLAEAADHP